MLVVAGGAGGGGVINGSGGSGGGGAGGLLYNTNIPIFNTASYTVSVGAGGAAGTNLGANGTNGSNSSIIGGGIVSSVSYTAVGGGGGGAVPTASVANQGIAGGSGGGGGGDTTAGSGGAGTPGQGFAGGAGSPTGANVGGGGGGGSANNGAAGGTTTGGPGGIGTAYNFANGTSVYYAGGGGGGSYNGGTPGTGGSGGGANGVTNSVGLNGTSSTGGGGGGTGSTSASGANPGGSGGSGTVIVSYPLPQYFTGGIVTNNNGANVVHTFNTSGTLTGLTTPIDTYQPYNTLLLHADNANGYNNGGFVDSVIGANTNIPFNGTYSYYFNGGTTDYLTSSASGSFYQLTGDFTIECWFKLSSLSSGGLITLTQTAAGNSTSGLSLFIGSSGQVSFFVNGNQGGTNSANGLVTTNTWYHITLVRVGSTNTVYLNGVSVASNSTTPTWGTAFVGLARVYVDSTGGLSGYISNVRIIKGQGLYTGAFTPGSNTLTSTSVGTSGANVASSITGTVMALTGVAPNYADYSANAISFVLSGTVGITNGSNTAIARFGTPTKGTFSPFSTTGWSNYFNGSTDYYTIPTSSAITLGTNNFTIELWVNSANTNTQRCFVGNQLSSGGGDTQWQIDMLSPGQIRFLGWYTVYLTSSTNLTANQWNHLAVVRNGTNLTMYLNGTSVCSNTVSPNFSSTNLFNVGREADNLYYHQGYISNLRITNGIPIYTSNFFPPTTQLTANSSTAILSSAFNSFNGANSTSNSVVMTISGTPQVQPFSPFNPTAAYSNTVVGSSMYFNGGANYLSSPYNASTVSLTGDFTVEFWANWSAHDAFGGFISNGTSGTWSGWQIIFNGSNNTVLIEVNNATLLISSVNLPQNAWTHVAWVRSGSSIVLYFNGVVVGTATSSATFNSSTANLYVGTDRLASYYITGYISNARIVNGTALYTSAFTPPTAPLTVVTNTKFLLNSTNAGIIDSSQKNQLTTYGSAAISTTQSKIGGTAMYFDGSTGYAATPTNTLNAFGSGDYTVECWIYPTNVSATQAIIDIRSPDTATAGIDFILTSSHLNSTTSGTTYITGSATLTNNQWYHIAIVRSGGVMKSYVNGVLDGTYSSSVPNHTNSLIRIGNGVNGFFSGYIDEVRITKGYARYTSNFTPQTSAFLNT